MKKIVVLMVAFCLTLGTVSYASAASRTSDFVSSLGKVATQLQNRHYRYGTGDYPYKGVLARNFSKTKYYGYGNCLDYVTWALEHSGNMPWNGEFYAEPSGNYWKNYWSSHLYKQPITIWMERGTRLYHDEVFTTYSGKTKVRTAIGSWYKNSRKTYGKSNQGEYPTLLWLRSKGLLKHGDIIVQWDNPKVRSPYTDKWQNKDNLSGTQQHVMVYTTTKSGGYRLYQVGKGGVQHMTQKYGKYGWKTHFKASGITNSNNDRRNRHHNPHVAFIVRLR